MSIIEGGFDFNDCRVKRLWIKREGIFCGILKRSAFFKNCTLLFQSDYVVHSIVKIRPFFLLLSVSSEFTSLPFLVMSCNWDFDL